MLVYKRGVSELRTQFTMKRSRTGKELTYKKPTKKRTTAKASQAATWPPSLQTKEKALEKKYIDNASAIYQVNQTGSITLLNGCSTGTDNTNRIGRKFINKSVYIRGYVAPEYDFSGQAAIAVTAQQARMLLVWDEQPQGNTPAITDILVEALPSSQLNLNNRDRFRILADEVFDFGPALSIQTATQAQFGYGGNQISEVKCFRKITLPTVNAGTGSNITAISSGALFMVWIGSVAAGTNVDTNAIVSTRVRFVDP